jgi:hypothetical protein
MAESEFEEMSVRDGMAIVNKMNKNPLWPVTSRTRQNIVNFLEQVMDDCVAGKEGVEVKHRIKAAEVLLAAQGQNLVAEKIQIDLLRGEGGNNVEQPKVVLLLPPNGSEAKTAVDEESSKV